MADATGSRGAAWKAALVLAPLAALGVWWADGAGVEATDATRDPGMEEVEAALRAGEAAPREGRPLIVLLGDSRYRAAVADLGTRAERETIQTRTFGGREVDIFGLVGRGVSDFTQFDDVLDRVVALRPSAVLIQPEMLVPHTNYHSLQGATVRAGGGLAAHRHNVARQWASTDMPGPGPELEVLDRLVARAEPLGIPIFVAEVPPAETVLGDAPEGYFAARRRLIASHLPGGERRYLRKSESYPDGLFRDYRHLTPEGSADWFPWAVDKALRRLQAVR